MVRWCSEPKLATAHLSGAEKGYVPTTSSACKALTKDQNGTKKRFLQWILDKNASNLKVYSLGLAQQGSWPAALDALETLEATSLQVNEYHLGAAGAAEWLLALQFLGRAQQTQAPSAP